MADYTLTVQIVDKVANQPLVWPLLLDGQYLSDTKQASYTVVLLEGNHIIELPPCPPGGGYASTVWRDQLGNILSESGVLSLNLTSDQQITLQLAFSFWSPGPPWLLFLQFATLGLAVVGTAYIIWRVTKKRS